MMNKDKGTTQCKLVTHKFAAKCHVGEHPKTKIKINIKIKIKMGTGYVTPIESVTFLESFERSDDFGRHKGVP